MPIKQMKSNQLYELRYKPVFANFTESEFNVLKKHLYVRSYKKGQVLFDEGDKREKVFYLMNGLVRFERYDESATFLYIDYTKPDRLFPYGGMFSDEAYHFSAYAATDIELYYLPTNVFEQQAAYNPTQLLYLYKRISAILNQQEKRIQYLAISSATSRIVKALTYLMEDLGIDCPPKKIEVPYPITINEIAEISGCSRETVGNVVKQLKETNKLEYEHKQFTFKDVSYFRMYAE
ncbi:Crp/Fnr family transcriptional regulator [Carnobacterium mobile]|uniref:Crp/Fnr family transcriptional regulator n=1 Tax=Carnobacterium mobile TaxID=2750 RepID=UPI0006919BB5|nr:Crp/Fnr family transcriptional regulator [Carnobacterium mobile]